jgi:hypothetical protein
MSEQQKNVGRPFDDLVRALQEGEMRRISQCIQEIDHRLLDCRRSLEEYRRLRHTLRTINNQLSRLGAEPLALADDLPTQDLGEIISKRIDHFKTTGKL